MPAALPTPPTKKVGEKPLEKPPGGGGGDDGFHPFIQGLLQEWPPAGTDWDAQAQAKWLRTAAHIFGMIYKSSEPVSMKIGEGNAD